MLARLSIKCINTIIKFIFQLCMCVYSNFTPNQIFLFSIQQTRNLCVCRSINYRPPYIQNRSSVSQAYVVYHSSVRRSFAQLLVSYAILTVSNWRYHRRLCPAVSFNKHIGSPLHLTIGPAHTCRRRRQPPYPLWLLLWMPSQETSTFTSDYEQDLVVRSWTM